MADITNESLVDLNASTSYDPVPTNNTSQAVTPLAQNAVLSITKTGPEYIRLGDNAFYTISVRNLGPSNAISVSMDDVLSPSPVTGLEIVNIDPGTGSVAEQTPTSFKVEQGLLRPYPTDPDLVIIVEVKGLAIGDYTNTAIASGTHSDPVSASIPIKVRQFADLAIVKTADKSSIFAGETITYTLTVINNGPDTATGVIVTDTLPAEVLTGTIVVNSNGYPSTVSGHTVTVTIGDLAVNVGSPIIITITAQVDPGA